MVPKHDSMDRQMLLGFEVDKLSPPPPPFYISGVGSLSLWVAGGKGGEEEEKNASPASVSFPTVVSIPRAEAQKREACCSRQKGFVRREGKERKKDGGCGFSFFPVSFIETFHAHVVVRAVSFRHSNPAEQTVMLQQPLGAGGRETCRSNAKFE